MEQLPAHGRRSMFSQKPATEIGFGKNRACDFRNRARGNSQLSAVQLPAKLKRLLLRELRSQIKYAQFLPATFQRPFKM